jgi:membrane protein CcdC involved in cytochrome C biogenesis
MINWLKHRLKHKFEHWKIENIKNLFLQHGKAFVIIVVAWEIFEDVICPVIFAWLGNNIDPLFLTGIPISLIMCLHPIAVPVIWAIYIKLSGNKHDTNTKIDHECCNHEE